MSSTLFRCQRCNQPLKLLAKQEGPLEAQQHVSPSPWARTSSSPLPDCGKPSPESAWSTFSLLDELTTQRTFSKLEGPLEAQQHVSPSPRTRTSGSPLPDWGKLSQESAWSTSLLGELTTQRTFSKLEGPLEAQQHVSPSPWARTSSSPLPDCGKPSPESAWSTFSLLDELTTQRTFSKLEGPLEAQQHVSPSPRARTSSSPLPDCGKPSPESAWSTFSLLDELTTQRTFSKLEGPLEAQQHVSPSPRARTSSSPLPDCGKPSPESAWSTFSLLDELTTQRTFSKLEGCLEAQQHVSPSPRARTSSSPLPYCGKPSPESAWSTFSLLDELTTQRTFSKLEGPLEAQQHVSPSPRTRTSSSPLPDWGQSSQESAWSTFSLLGELTTQRTFAKQEEPLEAQQHVSPSPRTRTSSSPLPDCGKPSPESAWSTFSLLGELTAQRTLNTIQNVVLENSENLSGQKDVDHPLCVDCTDNLLRELDAQLTLVEADTKKYRRFVERESLVSEEEREAMNVELLAELRSLEQEEARLAQELKDIDGQNARIKAELRAAQAESRELEQQEEEDLKGYAALTKERLELINELSSVENRLADAQKQLWRLRKTDIFNMTFTILDEGPLGIINNFRLGRLPGIQVEWGEINAAWGQTALLLFSLSKLAGLQFQRYQLVPCGDHSYLKSLAGDGVLPLFSDGSHRVFHNNKFDRGMKAFLDCLQQFVEEAGKKGLFLPYRIHVKRGVLEDTRGSGACCSISTHLNSEEEWAKALKFMLTNLKLILAWASSRYCFKIEPVWSHFK